MSGFHGRQTLVGANYSPAVEGDFCDRNPRYTVDAGPGGLVAGNSGTMFGASGVIVGRFAWITYQTADYDGAPATVNSFGTGPVGGFVHREQQALITTYLADASMIVPQGFPVTVFSGGGFWVKNAGTTQALPGQKAYANYANGAATFAATGSPTTGATSTASSVAAETATFDGTIAGNVLTVSAVVSGTIYPGSTLSNGNIASGTQIVSQLSGTAGGVGTYSLSIPEQTVPAQEATFVGSISGTTLTVTQVLSGAIAADQVISGPGVTAGTYIQSGSGPTYTVSVSQTVPSTQMSTTGLFISASYGLLTIGGTVAGTYAVNDTISGTSVVAGTTITALGTGTGGAGTYIVNNNTAIAGPEAIDVASVNVETKWIAMSSGLPGELVKISDKPLG